MPPEDLSIERFKAAQELMDLQMAGNDAKIKLDELIATTEKYLEGRELEVKSRVDAVLEASKDAISEAVTTVNVISDLTRRAVAVVATADRIEASVTAHIQQATRVLAEIDKVITEKKAALALAAENSMKQRILSEAKLAEIEKRIEFLAVREKQVEDKAGTLGRAYDEIIRMRNVQN